MTLAFFRKWIDEQNPSSKLTIETLEQSVNFEQI